MTDDPTHDASPSAHDPAPDSDAVEADAVADEVADGEAGETEPDATPSASDLASDSDSDSDGTAQDAARPRRDVGRTLVRGVGEVLVTLGVLVLLFTAYQLFWTNVVSAQAINATRDQLTQEWRDAPHPSGSASPTPPPLTEPPYGTPFALLYIPRLRDKVWGLPLAEGTGKDVLARGAGHYVGTAMPGQVGNFAIAAHRSTHDEPFANFPDLKAGDKVYVRTQYTWYVYTLTHDEPTLTPTDVWVVEPVPGHPGATPTQRLLTMTTCTPRYGSTGRWAWFGVLRATAPASGPAPDGINPES